MARKYSKKASADVERAMKKRNAGHAEERPLRTQGDKPQAGDRDRAFRGAGRGSEGAEEGREAEKIREVSLSLPRVLVPGGGRR